MIITWLWGHLSAILTRIFLFFAAPMNRNLKPAPKEPLQSIEKSPDGKEEKKSKEPGWKKYCDMPVKERRRFYRCGPDYVTVNDIPTWAKYWHDNAYHFSKLFAGKKSSKPLYTVNESLNNKVSLWRGDITVLEIDAIVNAANQSLLGGGGVDGCIHRAAGETLRKECATLNGCDTGDAKITSGHKLPAKYIIHTVGPVGEKEKKLRSCYENCLKLVKDHNIGTVAFCCISTGIYGYPNYSAAMVALDSVRRWLETGDNADGVQRIIFCTFLPTDVNIYESLLPKYFPLDKIERKGQAEKGSADESEDKHIDDEEDISADIPEPPTRKELLSGELAAGQVSGEVAMEGEKDLTAVENSGETTAGSSGETTVGISGGMAVESSGETTAGSSGETTAGSSGETTVGSSGETNAGSSGETNAGSSGETNAGSSGETNAGSSGETTVGSSGETTVGSSGGMAMESSGETTVESSGGMAVESMESEEKEKIPTAQPSL